MSSATTNEEDPCPLDSDDPALAKRLETYFEIIHRDNYEYTLNKEFNFTLKNREVTYEDIDEQLTSNRFLRLILQWVWY